MSGETAARGFGLTTATALIVGSIIGVGIFNLPTSLATYGPGAHRPTSTSRIEKTFLWPVFTNCSTYNTHPTAMAAFPAHAVIQ
jgi:hypothetical protein